MRKLIFVSLILCVASTSFARDTFVRGYTRSDGTYVQGHYRSAPDSSTLNNYSTRGNVNPYTGERGSRDPYSNYNSNQNSYQNNSSWQNNSNSYNYNSGYNYR